MRLAETTKDAADLASFESNRGPPEWHLCIDNTLVNLGPSTGTAGGCEENPGGCGGSAANILCGRPTSSGEVDGRYQGQGGQAGWLTQILFKWGFHQKLTAVHQGRPLAEVSQLTYWPTYALL